MSFLAQVEVIVLTWNEAPNIGRTLGALREFPRVLVLDSGSTDATLEIAATFPNVRLLHRAFDNHANQWNHAVQNADPSSTWLLALDADYVIAAEGAAELAALEPPPDVGGYSAAFEYWVLGRRLSGSLYPPVTVLFRREGACYLQDGHTQRLVPQGRVASLTTRIRHDDRKPLARWLASQDRYAELECRLLLGRPRSELGWRDRLRRLGFVTPWLVPLYCLTVGRGLLDGQAGLYYALQRAIAEAVLSLKLTEARLSPRRGQDHVR